MEKRIRAMYFSGTQTTAKVVSYVAYSMWQHLDEGAKAKAKDKGKSGIPYAASARKKAPVNFEKAANINFTPAEARKENYTFDEDDIVVFGVPVMAGRVPNILLNFLDTLKGGGALAVPIVVYGNRDYDDALIELRNILETRGFHTLTAAAFVGEHSFSKTLAAGRPDMSDMKVAETFTAATVKVVEKILDSLCEGISFEECIADISPVKVEGKEPYRAYYVPRDKDGGAIDLLKVKPVFDKEKCTECGTCAEICPMGSINKDDLGHVDGVCIKCGACVKKCPAKALYFDDAGYIYHKKQLEEDYADRKEPVLFF